jgi:hypothetical protein
VNVLPGAETRRHIAPGNAGPKLPDHSLDKQPIAEFAIAPNMPGTARQQFFNSRELVAAQSMTVHWGAFQRRLPMNQRFADSRIRSAEKIYSRITIVQHGWIYLRTRPNLTKSHFLRLGQNRRLSGSLRRDAPLLLTRIARVDSLVSQLIRDLEGELKLAVRQVTVCLDDG